MADRAESLPPIAHSIKSIAKRLDVSYRLVWNWVRAGKLEVYKLDRTLRITDESLERYLAARRDSTGAPTREPNDYLKRKQAQARKRAGAPA